MISFFLALSFWLLVSAQDLAQLSTRAYLVYHLGDRLWIDLTIENLRQVASQAWVDPKQVADHVCQQIMRDQVALRCRVYPAFSQGSFFMLVQGKVRGHHMYRRVLLRSVSRNGVSTQPD